MESFDMFLNGNFVAQAAFQKEFGVFVEGSGWTIPTKWQSALFQSGQCGAFVGVFLAGPITNRIGYRWTTILGLVLMNATIFISFFVRGTARLLVSMTNWNIIGQLTYTACCRTSLGRCSLGFLHRKRPSIC
jgi:SP family general alpha glucoside:H+ symporter-like MFS transporter